MIESIRIKNLYGLYNYDINRIEDSNVLILTGPNGFGKTTILQIINHFCNGKFWYFLFLPFSEILIRFSGQKIFKISKLPAKKDDDQYVPIMISMLDFDGTIIESGEFNSSYLDYLYRQARRYRLIDSSEKIEDLLEETYAYTIDDRVKVTMPKSVEYLQSIHCSMIEEQRLFARKKMTRDYVTTTRTVEDIQQSINKFYTEAQKTYNSASLKLDGSFVKRLSNLTPDNKGKHIRHERIYQDVVKKIAAFKKYGLVGELEVVTDLGVHYNQVLKLYLKDLYEKLSSLDSFYKKLHTFDRLVSTKELSYKKLVFEQDSFKIVNNSDHIVPISKLSSGEQHLIVLCYKLAFELDCSNLLLIDEPEKSLHVAWLEKLLDDYRFIAQTTGCQMIIATHSPAFIHGYWNLTFDLCEYGGIQEFTADNV